MTNAAPDEPWLLRQVRLFFIALQFFTRLPVPRWVGFHEEWLRYSARFFPLTGWVVGAAVAALAWGAGLILPPALALLLSLAFGILLTGALHEDGFADVCDGFGGGMQAERILAIMKDSRIGVYGAIGVGLLLAGKFAALHSLPRPLMLGALLAAHPMSRLLATALVWRLDYVRVEGKASGVARRMTGSEFLFAACCGIAPTLAVVGYNLLCWQQALAGLAVAVSAAIYLTRLFVRRIGGYTGDCLGAVQQLSEFGFYLGVVSCWFSY